MWRKAKQAKKQTKREKKEVLGRWREQGHTRGVKVERRLEKQVRWRSECVVSWQKKTLFENSIWEPNTLYDN